MSEPKTARDQVIDWARTMFAPSLVSINDESIAALAPPKGAFSPMKAGLLERPVGETLVSAISYILALNSLNYRFWELRGTTFIRYAYFGAIGALGMRKAFEHAWGDSLTPRELRFNLAHHGIEEIFGDIPDAASRRILLNELLTGSALTTFAAQLAHRIETTGNLTTDDAQALADTFPQAYADRYLKKAQLALAEVVGHCVEAGLTVTPRLTVFADYQVPRVLRALNILTYSPALTARVEGMQLIAARSPEEEAIRAATVLAGERIAERFGVDPSVVDNYLWTHRNAAGTVPFHLTETTDY